MKPTNIFSTSDNYKKYNNFNPSNKKPIKKNLHHQINKSASEPTIMKQQNERKVVLGENEDKNLSLAVILNREFDFQSNLRDLIEEKKKMG